eukprot:s4358_g5.t1
MYITFTKTNVTSFLSRFKFRSHSFDVSWAKEPQPKESCLNTDNSRGSKQASQITFKAHKNAVGHVPCATLPMRVFRAFRQRQAPQETVLQRLQRLEAEEAAVSAEVVRAAAEEQSAHSACQELRATLAKAEEDQAKAWQAKLHQEREAAEVESLQQSIAELESKVGSLRLEHEQAFEERRLAEGPKEEFRCAEKREIELRSEQNLYLAYPAGQRFPCFAFYNFGAATDMHWFLTILGCVVFTQIRRYPVPIPGLTAGRSTALKHGMQTTLHDHFHRYGSQEGEGCCPSSTGTTEAPQWDTYFIQEVAKSCGAPPNSDLGHRWQSRHVMKRSYKRACVRATKFGYTWYKGRLMTPQDLSVKLETPVPLTSSTLPQRPCNPLPLSHRPKDRWTCLTWNTGGLSQASFIEVQMWARRLALDCLILTETRWTFTAEWSTEHWHVIHSGTGTRQAGVMILVSRTLANEHQLGWKDILPGRILHLRIHLDRRAIDVLALYQFVDTRTSSCSQHRLGFWNTLRDTLQDLPGRNVLLAGGDLNCNLTFHPPHVGCSTFKWKGHQISGAKHADSHILHDLLQQHQLCVLNTFDGSQGPTYFHGPSASRIDFLITRLLAGDGIAKHAKLLPHADILPLNSTHHIPVLGSLRKIHVSYHKVPKTGVTLSQRLACRMVQQQDPATWNQFVESSCAALHGMHIPVAPSDGSVLALHQTLMPLFQQTFPGTRASTNPYDGTRQVIEHKWHHLHALRTVPSRTLDHLFQAWYHWMKFHCLRRHQKVQARLDLKQRFHDLCSDVDTAAARHDGFGMFQVINTHTPKKRTGRIRLRTSDGKIADQYTSHAMTVAFVQKHWSGPAVICTSEFPPPGLPFSLADLSAALCKQPILKAVAPGCLPGQVWRSMAPWISPLLYTWLEGWWNQSPPFIPEEWKASWIALIPKPGKSNTDPSHLRPISLQEPLGKTVMGLLTRSLQASVHPFLVCIPQFAYVSNRSCLDAICRVTSHCRQVRALLSQQRRHTLRQMSDPRPLKVCGGLQLLLDLSRAFDEISRLELFEHLGTLEVPLEIRSLLESWHSHTAYYVGKDPQCTRIAVGKGVRQGCKIAPTLWACLVHLLFSRLAPIVGWDWLLQHVTAFADDFHIGGQFSCEAELRLLLTNIGHVLDALEDLHLIIQCSKSHMIFGLSGTSHRHVLRDLLRHDPDGHTFALLRPKGTTSYFPVVKHAKYLGVVVGYGPFESLTMQHRIRAGKLAFHRLRPWFKSRAIGTHAKLHLWKQCIYTVLTYGLLATHVTPQGLKDLQLEILRMIRLIVGDHPYQTHNTHAQVLALFNVPHPLAMLLHTGSQLWRLITGRTAQLPAADIVRQVDWTLLPDQLLLIERLFQQTAQAGLDAALPANAQAQQHPEPLHTDGVLNETYNRDAQGFLKLDRLHVTQTQPFGNTLLDLVRRTAWTELADHPEMVQYLLHHCCICGVWNARPQELNAHLRLHHASFLEGVLSKSSQLCKLVCSTSPCAVCQKEFKRNHTCNCLTQASLLWLNSLDVLARKQVQLQCSICEARFDDVLALQRHLGDQHQVLSCDWNLARDQLPGADAACRHCGTVFQTRDGLRQHIMGNKCPHFDAQAPHVTRVPQERWQQLLQGGNFAQLLKSPADKLALTLKCQLCTESYTRQVDLQAHLQQAHGDVWMKSHDLVRLFLTEVAPETGCLCNPSTSEHYSGHVCPAWRQLAMMHQFSPHDLVVPMQYTDSKLHDFFQRVPEHTAFQTLKQILRTRQFDQLWSSPDVVQNLRHWCLLCGTWQHAGALTAHLHQCHPAQLQVADVYVPQLLHCLRRASPSDWECFACGQIFNLASDSTPVDQLDARRELQTEDYQMLDAFQSMAPLLQQAATYKRDEKEERTPKKPRQHQPPQEQQKGPPLSTILRQMALVILNLDRTSQMIQKQGCFVCFMQVSGVGILPMLTQQAAEWKSQIAAQKLDPQIMPLRLHLLQYMITELQARIQQLAMLKPEDQLWQAAVSKGTILADGSWPYLQWSHADQMMKKSDKPPLAMQRLLKHLTNLQEQLKEADQILVFKSLKPQQDVVAWALQIGLRADDLWLILNTLSYNTCWTLIGTTMKPHNLPQSRQAQTLAVMTGLDNRPQKGKGSTKGKSMGKGRP